MIHLHDLQEREACVEAQEAFLQAFPFGAPNWQAIAAHKSCEPGWRGWIAVHAPGLKVHERLTLADKTHRARYWRCEIALCAEGVPLETRLALAADLSNQETVAARAPGLTLAERLKLIRDSDMHGYWTVMIAVYAPDLTLAERLALAATNPQTDHLPGWRMVDAPALTPDYLRGWIAVDAPGLTFDERLELAKGTNKPTYWLRIMATRTRGLTAEQVETAQSA